MSTSEYGGRVRIASTRLAQSRDVSSHALRRLASNAHHYADQRCNHLVNWVAPAVDGAERTPVTTATTDFVRLAMYGPLPLTLRGDLSAYSLRLELAGSASDAGTVQFAAVLVPDLFLGSDFVDDATIVEQHGVIFTATGSSSPAWLTAESGDTFFDLAPSVISAGWGARATLTDTGGDAAIVDTCEVWLVIYAKTTDEAEPARLYGVHLSEYVGA